jgi:hypothetical protein
LIVTYVFLFLILCSLIYAILDIIVVGGIWFFWVLMI